MTKTHPTIKLFTVGAVAVIAGLLFFSMAAMARADTAVFEEPSQTRIPNGQHQVHWSYPTSGYQGCLADIEVAETNEKQPSPHPGNQLVVAIDGTVIVRLDIETGRGGFSVTTVQAVVGDVIEVWYVFGPDNVTSSGFAVAITCQEETPSTTTTTSTLPPTPPSTLPSSSTSTTSTTFIPTVSTTAPASSFTTTTVTTTLPSSSSTVAPTTLPPRLGSSTVPVPTGVPTGEGELPDTGLAVVTLGGSGLLLVVLGGLSVWATRRRR